MKICSAWVAVDDVDVDNSAMHVIPGSHRQLVPHISATEDQVFEEQADPAHFDPSQAVPIELKTGQFVLFNERLLHWSKPNTSDRRRFGLAVRVLASVHVPRSELPRTTGMLPAGSDSRFPPRGRARASM